MKEFIIIVVVVVILIILFYSQTRVEKRKITIVSEGKSTELTVEIADNFVKRAKGLMFRSSLPENEGMLFIFDDEHYYSFWMMNTTIPLEAIHIDSSGKIVDIVQMEPCKSLSCPHYNSKKPSKYVLEVNQGFSKKNKISINDSVNIYG